MKLRPGSSRPPSRPSTVDRLDPEIKAMIGTLRIEHGWTIDEIRAKLLELKTPVSRSALGRHVRSLEDVGAKMRHSRDVAQALVARVGDAPENKLAELNIELMHGVVLDLLTAQQDGESIAFDPEQVMFLARSMQALAGAQKTDVDRVAKLRAEALKAAAARVDKVIKATPGMTAVTVAAITHAVLGVET